MATAKRMWASRDVGVRGVIDIWTEKPTKDFRGVYRSPGNLHCTLFDDVPGLRPGQCVEIEPIAVQRKAKPSGWLTKICPECHKEIRKNNAGHAKGCDMMPDRRGGWRQLGDYDG